jgi:hypothetical protein
MSFHDFQRQKVRSLLQIYQIYGENGSGNKPTTNHQTRNEECRFICSLLETFPQFLIRSYSLTVLFLPMHEFERGEILHEPLIPSSVCLSELKSCGNERRKLDTGRIEAAENLQL